MIDGSTIQAGDVLIGLPSNGLHSNGYSLARKLFESYSLEEVLPELGEPLGETLLRPTRIYVKTILSLLSEKKIKGMVHITGGGLTENIPRILPSGLGVKIDPTSWQRPAIFDLLQRIGDVAWPEMYRTFNMGIGFVIIVSSNDEETIRQRLAEMGELSYVIGYVAPGVGVTY